MDLDIQIERDGERPIFLQIVEELERLVDSGRAPDGLRLPPSRDLAARLRVNRNTVVNAYQELIARDRATAHTGRGTFLRARGDAPLPWDDGGAGDRLSGEAADLHGASLQEVEFSFAANYPPEDLLPAEPMRRILDELLRRDGAQLLTYGSPAGYRPLREWIAGEMSRRGAEVPVEEVLITTGSQQAIDLAARAVIRPGDRVLMEQPGFPLAIGAFRTQGAKVEGVPLDAEGIRTDLLERAMEAGPTRLLYVMPDFQNPTGIVLGERRRRAVMELAQRHGVPILEDDSAGWLGFSGAAPPPLRALDRQGLVLFVATFSKMLMPGLRVGWMCAPAAIRDRIVGLKQVTDCTTSLILQAAAHGFCDGGGLDEHLATVREAYRARRDAMLAGMGRHFPSWTSWTEPEGGLALWVTLPGGLDARDVLAEARLRGVAFNVGELFFPDGAHRSHLRLTFGAVAPERIRRGIRRLGEVLHGFGERLAVDRAGAETAPLV